MVRVLLFSLFVLAPWTLSAAPVAALASLEGEVSVVRGGLLIPSEKISEGFPLEAFDTVTTGASGHAEVRFSPSTGLTGAVRLDSDTAMYVELSSLKREQTAGVELLTGAVTVRLVAVSGASTVEVRTEVGTFVGAGNGFRVVLDPVGDALVTTSQGKVQCRVDNRGIFVEPGSVAEVLTLERSVQTHAVNVSTVDSYEASWIRQRRQAVRDQVPVFFRTLASRYQWQVGLLQRAWDRTQRESSDAQGTRGAVANLRRAAFPLERSIFRIQALKKLFDEGTLAPTVEVSRGYTAADFFRQFSQERDLWSARLGESRALYRVQADQHGGDFPQVTEALDITADSAFFH